MLSNDEKTINKTLESAVFDDRILLLGEWDLKNRRMIERWIKTSGDEKRDTASKLIKHLVPNLLGRDCTKDGKVLSRNLGETFFRLEELLQTTKGGIARKFYRDHLNHMLRVMLLAKAVGKKLKCLNLTDEEIRLLTIAGLFHDIAYPLAEISGIFSEVIAAMKKCYKSLKYPEFLLSFDMNMATQLIQNLNLLPQMKIADIGHYFATFNHGLMGAMEFLKYIKETTFSKYSQALDAIIFHDPSFDKPIDIKERKLLSLLIICDEMQDWGRPASFEKEPTISEINDFQLDANTICGQFVWDKTSILSPFRQIYAKKRSIKRIDLSKKENLTIDLEFVLPQYPRFDYIRFETLLQKIFNLLNVSTSILEDLKKEIDIEVFEEKYYGIYAGNEEKLLKDLSNNKLLSKSPFQEKPLYFAPLRYEVLFASSDFGRLKSMSLASSNKGWTTRLVGSRKEGCGDLLFQTENALVNIYKRIVGELVLFNLILTTKQDEQISGPFRKWFMSYSEIEGFLKKFETSGEELNLVKNLDALRDCLLQKGFFAFIETELSAVHARNTRER